MSLSPLVGFSCRSLSTVLPVPLLSPDEFPLFLAGRLDHVDQFGFQLADLTVDGEQDSALVLASAGVVGIPGGIAVVIIGGSGTGIGGAVRPAAASGSRLAAGVPAVAASGVVLVVAVAGIAFPVIIRMQVIVQLEDPVPIAVIGHGH